MSATAPAQKGNAGSSVGKHTAQGQVVFELGKARADGFAVWAGYAGATSSGSVVVERGFKA